MQRTAMVIAGCLLLACGVSGDADPVSGSHASSALTPAAIDPGTGSPAQARDSVRARSAAEVSVCHRAGERWVPLSLPEAAVKSHVGNHGDFVYDVSAGECCTDADCGAGLSCTVGLVAESFFFGMCPTAAGGTINDPVGFLLAMGLFGSANGTTPPLAATLIRDATNNQYSFRFSVNAMSFTVALANFVGSETELGSETQVFVTFPARNAGLIKFNEALFVSYLNLNFRLSPTDEVAFATATVNLINATVANFTLDINSSDPETYPVVFLDSGGSYSVLGIRGVYVQPTSYIGNGSGPAGFYLGLLNGSVTANVLVFREAVYDVRL